ncbi:hypothetical protein [Egbenema bharatensis]|uniref:hypothetical protein n=1 Tax=Egbenema bharatensis TaxID=3463334 RepID=UPI003A88E644
MTISPSPLETEQLARQGHPRAIEHLINRYVQPTMTARVGLKSGCLHIMLEAVEAPNQQDAVARVQAIVTRLQFLSAQTIKIYGREAGDEFPSWSEEFEFIPQPEPDLTELAQGGDLEAIASLVNQWLMAPEIVVKVSLKQNTLHLILEAIPAPSQAEILSRLEEPFRSLTVQDCQWVKLYGRETGDEFPEWQIQVELGQANFGQSKHPLDPIDPIAQFFANLPEPPATLPEPFTFPLDPFAPSPPQAVQASPSEPQASCLEQAKQGDSEAISKALSYILRSQGITAKAKFQNGYLQVVLQAEKSPEQEQCVSYVRKFVDQLQLPALHRLQISGWRKGAFFQAWSQTIDLNNQENASLWGSLTKMVSDTGEAIGGAVSYAGQAVVGTTASTVGGAAEAIGGMATHTGQAVVSAAIGAGETAVNTAMQVPTGFGYVLEVVNNSPQLQVLTKTLQMDWLVKIVNRVDIVAAEARVHHLKRKHPKDKPAEIAHRIMTEKAVYVGGSGFASSLLPGAAAGMFAVDLATTTAMQAEMVYQIAAAYGLDLLHPDRKGEVLAIFGLALGGNLALKAGLGFLRNVPVAGAVIGASSNAVTLYALGYAACQFYESKLNGPTSSETVAASQAESEQYLQEAIAQQILMDQILVHVISAGNPGKTGTEILPELHTLNLSPVSLKVIESNIQSPPSLAALLKKVNRDFAIPLMAQCQKLVELDGVITSEEKIVLQTIQRSLNSKQGND